MIDHVTTVSAFRAGTSGTLVDLSARPSAPLSPGRARRAPLRTRARLAQALRSLAAAVEPRPTPARNRGTAAPACR
jgi:hypothetical protein